MKRFSCLFAAILAVLILVSCKDTVPQETASPVTTAAPAVTETEPASTDLAIVKDGVANYRIVRPEDGSELTIKAAARLREMIGEKTGVLPKLGTDWTTYGAEPDHEALEILVGATTYEESAQALEGVPYGDYVITRVGSKIVINAWAEEGITAAITALNRELVLNGSEGNFALPQDIHLTGTKVEIVNALPFYRGGTLRDIYDAGDKSRMLVLDDTDPEEYAAYRKELEAAGYTLYAENDIVDNRFATYTNDKYTVNVGYYAYEKACRAIIEPKTTLQPLAADSKYEKLVQPSVTLFGVDYGDESMQNGQCFVFQMTDGSYMIVDSGFPIARNAQDLYEFLYEHAPDKNNITIAAWIITHAHSDHYGAFSKFSDAYASKVKLEMVIANYPSAAEMTEGGYTYEVDVCTKLKARTALFANAVLLNPHVGHEFYLRDAKVEILYTLESFSPDVLSYFNDTSLVFTVELGGQKINVLGDAGEDACQIVHKMYGDYLKADFVQVSHHGAGTGSTSSNGVMDVYTKSASPVVLWPVGLGETGYAKQIKVKRNIYLTELETTKEIFIAGSSKTRLLLPYTVGTSGFESILK